MKYGWLEKGGGRMKYGWLEKGGGKMKYGWLEKEDKNKTLVVTEKDGTE